MGYSAEELENIPKSANMGLSCGNAAQAANLRPGEKVLDLGSGGGLDVFLASKKVGPTGSVVGVDMTPEMIDLARRNAQKGGYTNVEFVHCLIEDMDVASNSFDCAISNCVLNLCPNKPRAFAEVFRVLKPGGRLVASDILLRQPLPADIKKSLTAYVGCIAGASLVEEYDAMLKEAGFAEVKIVSKNVDLNAYNKVVGEPKEPSSAGCCDPATATSTAASSCCAPAQVAAKTSCCTPATTAGSTGCCAPKTATTSTVQTASVQSCCAPPSNVVDLGESMAKFGVDYDPNEWAGSYTIYAVKSM
ncbi:S-adenosyl-L-methionine-dependent methyltransferase [Gonapodya prolifera JEL478]|uniref:Arsenite methyltransferase n=1 Tax=Gonapodya prolifera (strain JEL478) TaxID=1344416 RepID=A0A139AC02_GONPJ|nr:S-adenosyl-L-methionine-dependent methyltransferase [Gonapodya prolifera JEL478]|eukprot:KXS14005.1 S-adenosyl-L-methionine-dependent methyltransferase [Gonapodya prolifera JEL478]